MICTDNDTETVIELRLGGLPGTASIRGGSVIFRGNWASHTGFRSDTGGMSSSDETDAHYAAKAAQELYNTAANYPFLVGNEYKEHGWEILRKNYQGLLEVRLPSWHKGIVAAALTELGAKETCKINNFWTFQEGTRIEDVKNWLAPILAEKTRFCDEVILAENIKNIAACSKIQISLF